MTKIGSERKKESETKGESETKKDIYININIE